MRRRTTPGGRPAAGGGDGEAGTAGQRGRAARPRPGARGGPCGGVRRRAGGPRRVVATVKRLRLDSELVRRGLARSREQAAQLIEAGRVTVGGRTAGKAATQVDVAAAIVVAEAADGPDY